MSELEVEPEPRRCTFCRWLITKQDEHTWACDCSLFNKPDPEDSEPANLEENP